MDRWACVDAFQFALQILLIEHPQWLEEAVAVLDRDDPQASLVDLNRHARAAGLRRGMRYGQALAMVADLHARAPAQEKIQKASENLATALLEFSPQVERDDHHPGTFWLNASGLCRLYPSWRDWVDPLKSRILEEQGLHVAVVVGFTRFATFAVARARRRSGLFTSPESERAAAGAIALAQLGIAPGKLAPLHKLGLDTVDDLLALPPEGVRRRFGAEIYEIYRQARGDLRQPLEVFHLDEPASHIDHLDYTEKNSHRLLFLIKGHLQHLLATLDEKGERLTALILHLHRRDGPPIVTEIRPARPTDDALLIADLVRLRLEALPVEEGITDLVLTARGERTTTEQMKLFAQAPRRDLEAAHRALARLRAEFGADAVQGLVPRRGHLPEAQFALEPLERVELPDVDEVSHRPAVRRFFPCPIVLRDRPRATLHAGPHILSGGWWVRSIRRDYRLLETDDGRLCWVFYDHRRRRWYLHGEF